MQGPITVVISQPQIIIQGNLNMPTLVPFSVAATINGQSVFTLPYTFSSFACVFLMGAGQDIIAGDYTVNGNQITLSSQLAALVTIGMRVYGAGQI